MFSDGAAVFVRDASKVWIAGKVIGKDSNAKVYSVGCENGSGMLKKVSAEEGDMVAADGDFLQRMGMYTDVAQIKGANDAAILALLRHRFGLNDNYTDAYGLLLCISPSLAAPKSADPAAYKWQGANPPFFNPPHLPPHPYQVANRARRELLEAVAAAAAAAGGDAGAGNEPAVERYVVLKNKGSSSCDDQAQLLLEFFEAACSDSAAAARVREVRGHVHTVLAALGQDRTQSEQCHVKYSCVFDDEGSLQTIEYEALLLNKSLLSTPGRPCFTALYDLLDARMEYQELQLPSGGISAFPILLPRGNEGDGVEAARALARVNQLSAALQGLGLSAYETNKVFGLLGAVLHLSTASMDSEAVGGVSFSSTSIATIAALLGLLDPENEGAAALTEYLKSSFKKGDFENPNYREQLCMGRVHALSAAIYEGVLALVLQRANSAQKAAGGEVSGQQRIHVLSMRSNLLEGSDLDTLLHNAVSESTQEAFAKAMLPDHAAPEASAEVSSLLLSEGAAGSRGVLAVLDNISSKTVCDAKYLLSSGLGGPTENLCSGHARMSLDGESGFVIQHAHGITNTYSVNLMLGKNNHKAMRDKAIELLATSDAPLVNEVAQALPQQRKFATEEAREVCALFATAFGQPISNCMVVASRDTTSSELDSVWLHRQVQQLRLTDFAAAQSTLHPTHGTIFKTDDETFSEGGVSLDKKAGHKAKVDAINAMASLGLGSHPPATPQRRVRAPKTQEELSAQKIQRFTRRIQAKSRIQVLHQAAEAGNLPRLRAMLAARPETLYALDKTHDFCSLHHAALRGGRIEVLQMVGLQPQDVVIKDAGDHTTAHYAALKPDVTVLRLLYKCLSAVHISRDVPAPPQPSQLATSARAEGWLKKLSSSGQWVMRYFVVDYRGLSYFGTKESALHDNAKPKDLFALSKSRAVYSRSYFVKNSIVVNTVNKSLIKGRQQIIVMAESEEKTLEWMQALAGVASAEPFRSGYVRYRNKDLCATWLQEATWADDTALHILARTDFFLAGSAQVAAAAWYIDHGCPVNRVNYEGKTALHLAIAKGNETLAYCLFKKGASVSVKDNTGKTPLDYATHILHRLLASTGTDAVRHMALRHALLPAPEMLTGYSYLSVFIQKQTLGVLGRTGKSLATKHPFLTFSAHRPDHTLIEAVQEVSSNVFSDTTHLWWGHTVHLQTPLEHMALGSYVRVAYSDQEDLFEPHSASLISIACFPIMTADSGIVQLSLDGKTHSQLTLDLQMHTRIYPGVDFKMLRARDPRLVYLPYFSTSMYLADTDDGSTEEAKAGQDAFNFKIIKEIYSTNYYEGDAVTKLQMTLPYDAKPGGMLNNIGGFEGVNIKVPSQVSRSPIINVMVPKFCLAGVPECRDLGLQERGKFSRVEVDLRDTDYQTGDRIQMTVDVAIPVRKLPASNTRLDDLLHALQVPTTVKRDVAFLCPEFPQGSISRKVMVVVNREDPLAHNNLDGILSHTDDGPGFEYDDLDGPAGEDPTAWQDNEMI